VYYYLRQRQAINDPSVYNCNKLIALHEAKKINFKIPNTIISKYTNNIRHFVSQNSPCITKDIQDVILLKYEDSICTSSTQKVDIEELTLSQYGYSLFQKEIKKRYELRIFYFLEDIYAMAIFSQMDANSQTDFRLANINSRKPIRQVPFCLPKMIEKQLKKLMKSLNLESGSIDMIVDNDNNYWFLEVNPVGQFHFLSQVCNYNIEQKIAKYLAL
jgi:glutathione synthase/RimK-type ligase-like ATP-grasp enzyme